MMMVLFLLKATALLTAALGVTLAMQRASAGARHLVWLVAFGALLILPPLTAWSPLHVRVLPQTSIGGPGASNVTLGTTGAPAGSVLTGGGIGATAGSPPIAGAPPAAQSLGDRLRQMVAQYSAVQLLLAVWGVVALVLGLWLVFGAYQVRRIVRRAAPLDHPDWQGPLYEIADRLGLDAAPQLLRSEQVKMPFACGLLRCTIVLPAESDAWSAERRSAVLIHELGHVRRRDLIGHTAGRVACALYWFHPLVWAAARKLRSESERACDDLALVFGAKPSDYAEHLLDIVTCVRDHATPSIALAMAHRKEFEGRMLAILDPGLSRRGPTRLQTAGMVGGLAVLAIVVCAAAPVPRMPVETAGVILPPAAHPASPTSPVARVEVHQTLDHSITRIVTSVVSPRAPANDSSHRAAILIEALATDSAPAVRRTAAWGLEQYSSEPTVAVALSTALGHDRDADVREMAAWALEDFDGPAVEKALITACRADAAARVRETAVWALGSHEAKDAAPEVDALLGSDPDANVRATAAWALGQFELARAPRSLLAALTDSSRDVRLKATWATLQIRDSLALPALRAALRKESSAEIRQALLRALLHSGEDPERMVEWLRSPDPALREIAVRALAGGHSDDPWPWPWPRPRPFAGP